MIAKFKIYNKPRLLIEVFFGEINLEKLQQIVDIQMKQNAFFEVKNTLTDLRKGDIKLDNNQFESYFTKLKELLEVTQMRWAILTNKPMSTAFSLLIKDDQLLKENIIVCSTLELASEFLKLEISELQLNEEGYHSIE